MKYFLLEAAPHVPQPQFLDWYNTMPPKKQQRGEIPQLSSFQVKLSSEIEFMDIITHPYLMLSKEFYQLVWMYDNEIQFKYTILRDQENNRSRRYGMPLLNKVKCLAPESEFNLDHSILRRIVLRRDALFGYTLFQIDGVKRQYVVASIALVESAFRRDVLGLMIKEIEVS